MPLVLSIRTRKPTLPLSFARATQILLDGATWEENLPWSIEAMFLMKGSHLDEPSSLLEEVYARRMHRTFIERYNLDASDIPLVQMDLSNPEAPFSAA